MNKNNNQAWKTKYGPRRVRVEAPTLGEAIFAAQGLTDDPAEQTEIAAGLMGLPPDKVAAEMPKPTSPSRARWSPLPTIPPIRRNCATPASSRSASMRKQPHGCIATR